MKYDWHFLDAFTPYICGTGRTRTYVAVLVNKRLRKCDRRRLRPVAKY